MCLWLKLGSSTFCPEFIWFKCCIIWNVLTHVSDWLWLLGSCLWKSSSCGPHPLMCSYVEKRWSANPCWTCDGSLRAGLQESQVCAEAPDLGPSRSCGQAQCVIELGWHLGLGEVGKYKVYNDVQMKLRLEQNCHPFVVLGGKIRTESWSSTMPRCDLYSKKWSRRSRVQDSKHQLSSRLAGMKSHNDTENIHPGLYNS